jgi:hypothetical protein
LNNPFSGNVACVPSEFSFPTLKQNFRASGTFTTGTAGFGFVSFNPFAAVFQVAPPDVSNPVVFSLSAFASLAVQPYVFGTACAITTSPYPPTYVQEQMTFRLVAAGLRVRNVTPLLNRGGSLIGIETMNHDSLVGTSIPGALLEDTAERCNTNSTGWQSVVYHPMQYAELSFYAPSLTIGVPFIGFLAQTTASDGTVPQIYEFEACSVVELKGSMAHGLTPSMSDPVGLGIVQNITSMPQSRKPFISDDAGMRLSRVGEFVGAAAGFASTAYRAFKGVSNPTMLSGPTIQMIE